MCVDPVTAVVVGSAVVGAVGTYAQGKSEANAERAQAQYELAAGYQQESLQRDQDRRQMATQVATLSARGMSLSSGSPLALLQTSARNAELNDLTIRANAQNKADIDNYKAHATMSALPYSIAGQLLGGASKLASLGKLGGSGSGGASSPAAL